MTPMHTPELPPESMYWNAFNEADSLAIIMRAQNYINNELIRKFFSFKNLMDVGTRESLLLNELHSFSYQKQRQQQNQKPDMK